MALAFVSFGQLPVNWVGVALILFSMGLFYFEMEAPGIGVFGAGGVITFLVGAFLLFGGFFGSSDPLDLTVDISLWLIVLMTVVMASAVLTLYFLVRQGGSADAYVTTDEGALLGVAAVALSDLKPHREGTCRGGRVVCYYGRKDNACALAQTCMLLPSIVEERSKSRTRPRHPLAERADPVRRS